MQRFRFVTAAALMAFRVGWAAAGDSPMQ